MALAADEVYQAGLQLDIGARATLAQRLLASLRTDEDATQVETDDEWREEVGGRVDDILDGRVDLSTFEQTRAKLRAMLDDLHR